MPNQVSKAKLGSVASCMTCPLCHELFRDATTIIECLHTFCRKCIFRKLLEEEMECCPVCNTDLGCAPLEKLRPDHNLQDIRAEIFPYKRTQVKAPEVATPVTLPAKRKERSLSSLVVSTPTVSTQNGMTGRRSKSTARTASRGSSFIVEKHFRKEEDSNHHPESSSSREILAKFTQIARQNLTAAESSNHPNSDKGRENGSEVWEGKLDPNGKPLTCLVEAASTSKSSKFTTQESVAKSESHDNERDLAKTKHKENRLKSEVQAEKCTVPVPQESERPEELRRGPQKKGENSGEFRVPPQVVLDAACAKFERKNHPIWFSPAASVEQDGDAPLPQIASSYLRIKQKQLQQRSQQELIVAMRESSPEQDEFLAEVELAALRRDISLLSENVKKISSEQGKLSVNGNAFHAKATKELNAICECLSRLTADLFALKRTSNDHNLQLLLTQNNIERIELENHSSLRSVSTSVDALNSKVDSMQAQIESQSQSILGLTEKASTQSSLLELVNETLLDLSSQVRVTINSLQRDDANKGEERERENNANTAGPSRRPQVTQEPEDDPQEEEPVMRDIGLAD